MFPLPNSKLLTSHLLERAPLTLVAVLLFTAALQGIAQQPNPNEQQRGMGLAAATTEKRVALVIGNSRYETSSLRNPVNDANLVAATLREMGFDVIARTLFQCELVLGDQKRASHRMPPLLPLQRNSEDCTGGYIAPPQIGSILSNHLGQAK